MTVIPAKVVQYYGQLLAGVMAIASTTECKVSHEGYRLAYRTALVPSGLVTCEGPYSLCSLYLAASSAELIVVKLRELDLLCGGFSEISIGSGQYILVRLMSYYGALLRAMP